jgi:hypothetical protein
VTPVIEVSGFYLNQQEAESKAISLNTDLTKLNYRSVAITHVHTVVGWIVVPRPVWEPLGVQKA